MYIKNALEEKHLTQGISKTKFAACMFAKNIFEQQICLKSHFFKLLLYVDDM